MIPDNHVFGIAEAAINQYGALQDQWEMAMLLHYVQQIKPAKLLEIGSYTGGSLYAWRKALPDCQITAVTLGDNPNFISHGASVLYGDSTSPVIKNRIWQALDGQADFVFIDGGHDEATAISDFAMAVELTHATQGWVGIHDINLYIRYPGENGPRIVWDENKTRYRSIGISNITVDDPGFGLLQIR